MLGSQPVLSPCACTVQPARMSRLPAHSYPPAAVSLSPQPLPPLLPTLLRTWLASQRSSSRLLRLLLLLLPSTQCQRRREDVSEHRDLPACLLACVRACLPAYLRACVRACLPTCMRACLPACIFTCCGWDKKRCSRHAPMPGTFRPLRRLLTPILAAPLPSLTRCQSPSWLRGRVHLPRL